MTTVPYATIEDFERDERRQRRLRAKELARKGLSPAQIAERTGMTVDAASKLAKSERGSL